ncbi:type II toxin-antitoxin system PemK/MazF family toxin [bacterium (Candidatus Blackallbacteria) CG17_big_fil_post_rev_8_21_14_2_50_48_46]|uniref:mRNA interferase n=1 Tax=bacterium (Candidatus Blackallbacteria) CG17_big_fil_post_rev_8_21_14_2_50_48_46 TaxID=2014261 RepID=A0A2M7G332_9BACT|nr:MAG: MazF family transcriptional regulator [bacterium (Candidatus Blackallbacteria) CG18_big_fil_WC_8_21_14_2_50_49_26]PIW15839.1 MAG: type II toxin-antitoxin system PemK/MazF family toxin [bacterium (Candidatus Blackallbacteria) CG17_big_fil_post_rev_8_21_14_2_50_48_46]PIW48212.1 MAG: type II toxin-antitoxin system PemK/MazF family toxin [bacterium (Candidatus Blackallbacteria) CG13_big_fil_rev_8_21_14_2_50_49_14]
MNLIQRGMVIDVNLEPVKGSETGKIRPCIVITNNTYNARVPVIQVIPITEWSEKKSRVVTNCVMEPSADNGLDKRSIADCLQTRPIDWKNRFVRLRGHLSTGEITLLENALRIVFAL